MTLPQRPLRGSRISSFYPIKSLPSLASLDSAFQLQEYISLLIRLDVHDVEAIVSLPGKSKEKEGEEGEKNDVAVDEACWIYEQLRRLAQDLTHPLITTLQQECNRASCPEMKAGEWLYLCVAHGNEGAMEQCCAIDYILHTLDSATALLNTPRAFPSRLQIPATSHRHFTSLARRLGRIFAHAYFHHREAFEQAEAESSLYARFLALTRKFDLVPAEFLVIPSRGEEDGREEEVPRLMGAAVDHRDREEWTPERSVPPIERQKSQSPPGLGSESPRKMGRNRTDTMVLNEAVVVADELAKVEEVAARSGEQKPASSAGEAKSAFSPEEEKPASTAEEEKPASSATEPKPTAVVESKPEPEPEPEPEQEKPAAPAPGPISSALDLSPSELQAEMEAGGEPPKTVEESVSMSTEEAASQPQPAPKVAEVEQVTKDESPEPTATAEVVQPELEPMKTHTEPGPDTAIAAETSGEELVPVLVFLAEEKTVPMAEEKSVLVPAAEEKSESVPVEEEEKSESEFVPVPVAEEKTEEQREPEVVVVEEEEKSEEGLGKEVGKSEEAVRVEVGKKEKSEDKEKENIDVPDAKPGVEEKVEEVVEKAEEVEKVEDKVEEGKTEKGDAGKEKAEVEKVEETEEKVEEPTASASVPASASV